MAEINFTKLSKVYLDTVVYIYLFEDNPRFAKKTEKLFLRLEEVEAEIIASNLLLTELLVAPLKEENDELARVYENLPDYIPNLRFSPLDRETAVVGAQLRAEYGLRTPDAIHIATAVVGGSDIFFTAYKQVKKVKEIKVAAF